MKKIVLASTSFRRQELLRWTGLEFEIVAPDFEESALQRADFPSTAAFVEALSFGKALSVSDQFPDAVVISGDTMIELDGQVIGKPRSLDHAREILKLLSGRTHLVFSGVTMIDSAMAKTQTDSVVSEVRFKPLSTEQIERYVQTGEPLGKAGAYGIQSGARAFVDQIDSSWTNVIGFPLLNVAQMLTGMQVTIPVNIRSTIKLHLGVTE